MLSLKLGRKAQPKELWRINIKQAIQGLFTTGTSEAHKARLRRIKEKVGGKRGLTLRYTQGDSRHHYRRMSQ